MNLAAITNTRSRTLHVVTDCPDIASVRGTRRPAACGREVEVRWYELNARHSNVCQGCRNALGWGTDPSREVER